VHEQAIVAEFTAQAESFNASALATSESLLDALVELASPHAGECWLDAACGPGIVCRRLAAHAGTVLGVDLTAAMLEVARRETSAAGLENVSFALGDATALELPDAQLDGALARFTLHHVPLPGRVVGELARVVRPGGRIVLADHLADEEREAFAWSKEIERLRDPSHWASLPLARLRELGERAGLALERERVFAISLEFEDWLRRGSTGASSRVLIERALAERPGGSACFRVRGGGPARTLELQLWASSWRR
jgi:SAM-dependent methyltransferase